MNEKHLGKLPPRYSFLLNPYSDVRLSKCPQCHSLARQKKFALLIHIDAWGLVPLGKTCRWCPRCELIMAHQDELENILAQCFSSRNPDVIGNKYLVMGTVDMQVWRKGLKGAVSTLQDVLDHTADFKMRYDLKVDPGGWRVDSKQRR